MAWVGDGGKKGSLVTIEDLLEIFMCPPGFNKASVTDAMQIFFVGYGDGGFDIEDETTKGPGDEDMNYGQGARKLTGKFKSEASNFDIFNNLLIAAAGISGQDTAMKNLNGMVHLFMRNKNNEFLNLWQKPDLQDFVGTPACSTALSLKGTKLHIGKDGRYIEYNFTGWLTDAQIQYITAQMAAYVTAGTGLTGGTTLGWVIPTSSRSADVLDPYFHTVTIGGGDVGILDDAGIDIEITGGDLQMNNSRTLQVKVTQFAETRQASLVQLGTGSTATLTDQTMVLKSVAGETITTTNARLKLKTHFFGRNKASIRIEHTMMIPISQVTCGGSAIALVGNVA